MDKKVIEYFNRLEETSNDELIKKGIDRTDIRGIRSAFWAYSLTINNHSDVFECNELPWTTDMAAFVKTLREAGVETIAVTETSTALLENLHKLAAQGCTVEGLCTVTRQDYHRCNPNPPVEVPAIKVRLN